jgi:hypothetical protein
MVVFHFGGKVECNSFDELVRVLLIRFENNSNEYEIYGSEKLPFMTILVKGELACVHIFRSNDDCGSYAYWNGSELDKEGVTVFYMGTPTSETEISNRLVIPFSLAIDVARDFFENLEMSKLVEWFEL